MGSLADGSGLRLHMRDGSGSNTMDEIVTPKPGHRHHRIVQNPDGSCSSSVSTPEPDAEVVVQDPLQRQKRKGGRKPIYATSEERKQRNRQAQAAFRERRTEYIKQLESTIKVNEDTLQTLQQSHRSAADECLMLRYKNSLLERILLEKGIDVQGELRLKSGSPAVPSAKLAPQVNNPSPLSRPPMSRHASNRMPAGIVPNSDTLRARRDGGYSIHSAQLQPTPSSHVSSPSTAKSPGFPLQSPISDIHPPPQQQQQQHHTFGPISRANILSQPGGFAPGPSLLTPSSTGDAVEPNMASRPGASGSPLNGNGHHNNNHNTQSRGAGGGGGGGAFYMSPFQKHYEQLDQEYDAQGELVDDPETTPEGNVYQGYRSQSLSRGVASRSDQSGETVILGPVNALFDHYDPMLDADPFGLTASMHFPTPFNFNQHPTRS